MHNYNIGVPNYGIPFALGLLEHIGPKTLGELIPALIFCSWPRAILAITFLLSVSAALSINSLKREKHFFKFLDFNLLIFISPPLNFL